MGVKAYLIRVMASHAKFESILSSVRIHNDRVRRAIRIDQLYAGAIPNIEVIAREHPELVGMPLGLDRGFLDVPIARWACDDWIVRLDCVIINEKQAYLQFLTSRLCEPADEMFDAVCGRDFIQKVSKWKPETAPHMPIAQPTPDQDMFETLPTFREMKAWLTDIAHTPAANDPFVFDISREERITRDMRAGIMAREASKQRTIAAKKEAASAAATENAAPQP